MDKRLNPVILIVTFSLGVFGLSLVLFQWVNNITWQVSNLQDVQELENKSTISLNHSENPQQINNPPDIGTQVSVTFETASALITDESQEKLNQLASKIAEINPQSVAVQVIGHSSFKGSADLNQTLSRQRAFAVTSYLRARGLRHKIVSFWKGADQPLPNIQDQSNQRVEIRLVRLNQ
jgi:outer membrane protein OmpA-like peptidoglycan-associated protein